ncbi:Flp family type IVb pilin [Pseudomonas sp. 5P_5.1_Bac1]|uniref:Flp family type IVb pilin n=1 Tax=Pseudomonas sp. 5P_5.1_Bac1 TaxID=2971616 RepID=UPI0021C76D0E|nr:Flp family type IVb pilin [Pseudomonas sp. 5P_5.1_Bac1]MCU1723976.1 Flp family type IVb pilin [Pseudomonas sp. 5P_5.1_Bac1]
MRLSKIIQSIRGFFQRTDGASGIEYALVAAMVAVALVAFVPTISEGVTTIFTSIEGALPAAD